MAALSSLSRLDHATRRVLEHECESIRSEYGSLLEPDVVEECLEHSLDWLPGNPRIRTFVPVLALRHARQELRALAQR